MPQPCGDCRDWPSVECAEDELRSIVKNAAKMRFEDGNGLQLSCCYVLQVGAVNLVRLTGCAVELRQPAVSYLRIRALGLCASLVSMVCQAGLLAQRNSLAPLMSVLASAGINLIVDILLIVVGHPACSLLRLRR